MKKQFLKLGLAMILFFAVTTISNAQTNALHVTSDGHVGINTTTPYAKLHVENPNYYRSMYLRSNHTTAGTTSRYGIMNYTYGTGYINGLLNYAYQHSGASSTVYALRNYAFPRSSNGYGQYNYVYRYSGTGASYGLYSYVGQSSTLSNTAYGLYSYLNTSGTGARYGVYSNVATGASRYAGYFNGDVHITGSLTVASDAGKKKNVRGIENAVDLVQQLEGKSYEFIEDETNNFSKGTQFGFLAQELEGVLPELVTDIEAPGKQTKLRNDEEQGSESKEDDNLEAEDFEEGEPDHYKSVNYIGLIPILVEAIKEQQAQLEAQEQLINELQSKVK